LRAKGYATIVAAVFALAGANVAAATPAVRAAVRILPDFPLSRYAATGAVASMVPASGSTVSRASARASLVRGKLENSLLGGRPSGKPLIRLGGPPAAVTIYVALPPAGKHHNFARYPIAIVGGDYHGLLLSSSTRIPGLVSIADVAPTVRSLARGEKPILTSRTAANAVGEVRTMNQRLEAAHFSRRKSTRVLIGLVFGSAVLAWALRSALLGRLALLVVPAMVLGSTIASALHVVHGIRWWSGGIALALALPLALASTTAARFALSLAALLGAYAVFLGGFPTTVSLAALGPHPEGGGRYFGMTNQIETLLLAPALALGALVALPVLPLVALASLVVVGWSRLGADGGGLIVYAAGFAALALLRTQTRITPLRAAAAAAAVVALGLALVGLDALTGGSSHVTHAVGGGPGSVFSDVGHRLHLSWRGIVDKTDHLEIAVASLVTLVVLALLRPRSRALDALLAALVISLLLNDSGFDILRFGALVAIAVLTWSRLSRASVDSRAMRVPAAVLAGVAVLVAAGCGYEGTVEPFPKGMSGTVAKQTSTLPKGDASAGKALFASNGCGGCHTYAPAKSNGKTGPDLDKLPQYAQQANQGPLDQFVETSIVNPSSYVQSGYQDVMPKSYGNLTQKQLADLVTFLTQKQ
jgi:cytochrome c551/c552